MQAQRIPPMPAGPTAPIPSEAECGDDASTGAVVAETWDDGSTEVTGGEKEPFGESAKGEEGVEGRACGGWRPRGIVLREVSTRFRN